MKDRQPRQHSQALRFLQYSSHYDRLSQQPSFHRSTTCLRIWAPIPMDTQDIYKAAVITPIGLFEYVLISFGLNNAAQIMQQRYIVSIIRDIPNCYAYLDDLLIASSDQETDGRLSLKTDSSDFTVGTVLQQNIESTEEPLGLLSRKLIATEKKYSTFDRELLSVYLSVKLFRYMLEGREVVIYTVHKPLLFAFTRIHDNSTPR
ncbi:hypothetical protein AVEN_39643-1 [Araneus ventricosus]|uniref:Reverse transcriptase RNase H-like domain-containing protein n=1 Tax=Araneus ventricosus TaxID=182803 RepID=A0A4Y2LRI2_ARAVE|nr:hypothetical protein AVEN_39643-1 [Araneus ventricosus]